MRTNWRGITVSVTAGLLALATAAAAQPVVPTGDSYLCYKAGLAPDQEKFTPVQKTLEDQFRTLVVDVKGFVALCNPTQSAAHPAVHAVGYKLAPAKAPPQAKFVKSDHTAIDQFGTHPLTVVKPIEVRAPSAKVLGAGGTGTVDTTGVDHFECYKATPAKGTPKFVPPAPVAITDQFGTQSYTLKKITKLCTPVNKNGEDATAPQHVGHLVCYQAKLPAGAKFTPQTVSVNNANFGPAVLVAKAVLEVCVPAFKDTVPPTTTSTTTSITTSSTTASTTTTTLQLSCSAAQPCPGGVECCSGTCLPPDASCWRTCSVTTSRKCLADADCRIPNCTDPACFSGQTCLPPHIVPNRCGAGTCLTSGEFCCGAAICCQNGQTCGSPAHCFTNCLLGTQPCGDDCCTAGETCVNGACKTLCGAATCYQDTETCCGSVCCDTATQVCGAADGHCQPRQTCTGTDVYIPSRDVCCPQQSACGNTACCNLSTTHCNAATGQCVPNP